MKEYCRFQFGNNTAFESVGTSATNYYGLWVNRAYNHLTTQDRFLGVRRDFFFPQLETYSAPSTSDGVKYVETPSDALVIRQVYDSTNNRLLRNISQSEYLSYTDRSTTTAEGEPTEWVRNGAYINFHPTPDATYALEVHYRKIPAAMTSDSATTEIGDEWDDVIVQMAVYYGKLWTSDYEGAKVVAADVNDRIASLVSVYGKEERARHKYLHLDETYKDGFGY